MPVNVNPIIKQDGNSSDYISDDDLIDMIENEGKRKPNTKGESSDFNDNEDDSRYSYLKNNYFKTDILK